MLIRETLCDIALTAYPDFKNPRLLKMFTVELHRDEQRKSLHGYYSYPKEGRNYGVIIMYNFYREDSNLLETCIHELAHHVDWCHRKTSGHDKQFYQIYEKLLFAAFDMGVINCNTFNPATDASGYAKVNAMVKRYVPHPIDYKQDKVSLRVPNGYKHKDRLKEAGYRYNGANASWEKEVSNEEKAKEIQFLEELKAEYLVEAISDISFVAKSKYLVAGAGSYEIREELKEAGFRYSASDRCWKKKIPSDISQANFKAKYQRQYPAVVWKISST